MSETTLKGVSAAAAEATMDYLVEGEIDYERLARNLIINIGVDLALGSISGEAWGKQDVTGERARRTNIQISASGNPQDILFDGASLNGRQKALLEKLPGFGDTIIVNKRDISLKDLAAITTDTGNEFAMFSMGGRRFIMRGDFVSVPIDEELASVLAAKGWRWPAHSRPGMSRTVLAPSENDRAILKIFKNQTYSSTVNSVVSEVV